MGQFEAELYAFGWRAARALPEPFAAAAFDRLADAAYLRRGRRVRRLEANLRRALGPHATDRQVAATTHAALRSYCRYWMEVFRLPVLSREVIVGRMRVDDEWRLREAFGSGRGVILALPHMGNWDHAGAWCVHTGMPFTTVAEVLQPQSLFDRFVAFRESLGMEVLPLTGGAQPPFDVLADRLRAGGMVCLLADRDLTANGVEVEFFGAPARMPGGPAALAAVTGAALLPVTLWYPQPGEPRGWRARIHPEVVPPDGLLSDQVAAMTQQLAREFADGIAAHPQDWHMLSRLWVDDLAPARVPVEVQA